MKATTTRPWLVLVLVLLGLAPAAAANPIPTTTLAVSYFDNNSGDATLDPLARGLADMLITDLGKLSALQIVERERLNDILAELNLAKSKFIDVKTAVKLGKGLSAAYILTGGYMLVGEVMRIDVRIFAVESGKIVASDKIEGAKHDFFALEKDLVDILVKAVDVKVQTAERTQLRKNATESYDAFFNYSLGLMAKDRGDEEAARAAFQAAIAADPSYQAAKDAMGRLKAVLGVVDDAMARAWTEQRAALDPKAPDFGMKVSALLGTQVDDLAGIGRKLELLTWLEKNDYAPTVTGASPIPIHVLAMATRVVEDPAMEDAVAGACEYFIKRYPGEMVPPQMCKSLITMADSYRKTGTPAERSARLAAYWKETLATVGPEDWRRATIVHWDGMCTIVRKYAARAKRP